MLLKSHKLNDILVVKAERTAYFMKGEGEMRYISTEPEKTFMRVNTFYSPEADIGTDSVTVCRLDETTADRIKDWRAHGYTTHFITSLSWGNYSDYLNGKYDGKNHWDEAQKDGSGAYVLHGLSSPYMVPTLSFTDYLSVQLSKIIDMGIRVIFLEEPVFFTKSGYSDAFKTEWEIFYGSPWQDPKLTEDAQFKASKLKAFLLRRCVVNICTRLKYYAKTKYNCQIKIYSVLNGFINYSQRNLITPGRDLASRPQIDGFAANISAENAKTPVIFNGRREGRVFESAYLEYGIIQALSESSGKEMIFINSPSGSNPKPDWYEISNNYEKILTASLLYPGIKKYEVCADPEKLFGKREKYSKTKAVPESFKTTMLTVMNALRRIQQETPDKKALESSVGIFMSDTAMFQRQYPDDNGYSFAYADSIEEFSCFYGISLPLMLNGLHIRPLILENLTNQSDGLFGCKVAVLSYEFMKPLSPAYHHVLCSWVRNGGVLVYVGEDSDSFNKTNEWWQRCGCSFSTPAGHLFDTLGITAKVRALKRKRTVISRTPSYGIYDVGKGAVAVLDANPAKCAQDKAFSDLLLKIVTAAAERCGAEINGDGLLKAERGPYRIIAALNTQYGENIPIVGNFINLLSENLEYQTLIVAEPGSYWFLYDIDAAKPGKTAIIACSAYTEELIADSSVFSFYAKAPEGMQCCCRLWLPDDARIIVNGTETPFTREKSTVFFTFEGGENKIEILYEHHEK